MVKIFINTLSIITIVGISTYISAEISKKLHLSEYDKGDIPISIIFLMPLSWGLLELYYEYISPIIPVGDLSIKSNDWDISKLKFYKHMKQ